MAGYACPVCGKKSRLPGFCCGQTMVQQGTYYCDRCRAQSNCAADCCGSPMKLI
ncbi:MAG: hypothetical protein ACOZCL_04225 [Bacillota bacterium]